MNRSSMLKRVVWAVVVFVMALIVAPTTLNRAAYQIARPVSLSDEPILQTYLYGEGAAVHKGVDFSSGVGYGDPIYAVFGGVVEQVVENRPDGCSPSHPEPDLRCPAWGNYVLIRHNKRHYDAVAGQLSYVYSLYLHLRQGGVFVDEGQTVAQGALIAAADDTGNSTGHHLHLQMVLHPESGRTIEPYTLGSEERSRNPELWLVPYPGTARAIGRVSNASGAPVEDLRIYGMAKEAGWSYGWNETYSHPSLNPDDLYFENFGTTDVSPGTYTLVAKRQEGSSWVTYKNLGTHAFAAGRTTYIGLFPVRAPYFSSSTSQYGWDSTAVVLNNSPSDAAQVPFSVLWPTSGDVREQFRVTLAPRAALTINPSYSIAGTTLATSSADASGVVQTQSDNGREQTNYTAVLPQYGSGFVSPGWEQTGTTLYAPVVKRGRYGRSSTIYVVNTGWGTTTVSVVYYDASGVARAGGSQYLAPNGRAEFSPGGSGSGGCGASGTVCSARITSSNGQPLAGVVREYNDADGKVVATHNLFNAGSNAIYFPVVKYDSYDMTTGLSVQNVGGGSTNITVRYYRKDGSQVGCTLSASSVPPRASRTFLSGSCPGSGFVGTAVATASQPLVGMANEASVRGEARKKAYSAYLAGSRLAYAPLVYRSYSQGGYLWDCGIAVRNLDAQSGASVSLYYYDVSGNLVGSQKNQVIAKNGMAVFVPPKSGFKGSALISADRNVVAVVNVVNNASSGDTHAIYNASNR